MASRQKHKSGSTRADGRDCQHIPRDAKNTLSVQLFTLETDSTWHGRGNSMKLLFWMPPSNGFGYAVTRQPRYAIWPTRWRLRAQASTTLSVTSAVYMQRRSTGILIRRSE